MFIPLLRIVIDSSKIFRDNNLSIFLVKNRVLDRDIYRDTQAKLSENVNYTRQVY